ncbi:methionyl-tRNA formyltransferase [Siphonobacter sp. BAB-5385]|uniref:methionyl-tRNA formyltransferase n=1 Tax=Siphonobacter sp. BAB-5385 TaxID=1864822 RepID=UPI0015955A91|nr:methionyl-tRNA formyltransferase [Siphonobacter sp. BAB-5385]
MRIIFLGTPEFAVESLRTLVENQCEVVAVVTAPDKPAGRGQQLQQSPVKQYAVSMGLPVLQPEKLKNPDFLEELKSYQADLQVIVAFRMLPEVVWNMPPKGTFNLHASLLPQYRGAAPINWALMNGETETGVTTFFLQHEIDTGPLIFQEKEPISEDDTVGAVYERLMKRGGQLVLKTVRAIEAGEYPQIPQPEVEEIKMAPKIFKETCEINWQQSAASVRNHIRGLSPYPAAWTTLLGKNCKVYRASFAEPTEEAELGSYRTDHKTYLQFRCSDGWLAIDELQLEGKKRMGIEEFLRGMQGKL